MDLETEYFFLIQEQVTKRTKLIYDHFGKNFLEEYTKPEQRDWYKLNVAPIDKKIVSCANFVSGILLLDKNFTKIAEIFKDKEFNDWFIEKRISLLKEAKRNNTPDMSK